MKTKFIVILIIQTFLIFVFFVYALVQQTAAKKSQRAAFDQAQLAKQSEKRADADERIAVEQRKIAEELAKEVKVMEARLKNCH